jgi:hypothetical protein
MKTDVRTRVSRGHQGAEHLAGQTPYARVETQRPTNRRLTKKMRPEARTNTRISGWRETTQNQTKKKIERAAVLASRNHDRGEVCSGNSITGAQIYAAQDSPGHKSSTEKASNKRKKRNGLGDLLRPTQKNLETRSPLLH